MSDASRVLTLPMTAAYFRLILRRFASTPACRAALLAGTGIESVPHGPDAEVTVAGQLRQLVNLDGLAPAGWGLELGAALDGSTHGPAGAAIVTAPTLRAALEALARYATVRTPFIDFRASTTPRSHALEVVETCDLGSLRTPLLELVLLSVQGVVESALGRRLDGATFRMPSPRPPYWRRYAGFFHAPVEFGGRVARVSLPAAWLDLPCPLADAVVQRSVGLRLESLRERLTGDFVDAQVERLLDGGSDAGASLVEMAARLRVSSRTLVRRLGDRNTSYRTLLDGHRRRRAVELLAQERLTVAEIAERLGYEAPTNFGRACRRWFGMSPRSYRESLSSRPML